MVAGGSQQFFTQKIVPLIQYIHEPSNLLYVGALLIFTSVLPTDGVIF